MHRGGQLRGVELADPPGVGLRERLGALAGLGQLPLDPAVEVTVDEWGEIPLGFQ